MKRQAVVLLLLGWILWFTQEDSRPRLVLPSHWSMLGWFDTESACNAFGQRLIDQIGHVSPQNGSTRNTAAMTMLDTRTEGQQDDDMQHEVQTALYCMPEDVDPRISTKK